MTQIICPISGIKLIRAPYMLGLNLREEHPIFRMKRRDLITTNLVHQFTKALDTEEKKLYFLGVLNCTDLVDWSCVANPSLHTIENNFLQAMEIAGWIDYAAYQLEKGISLPRYKVGVENQTLDNVKFWIQAIKQIRDNYINKVKDKETKSKLERHTQLLLKELGDAYLKDRTFTPAIARWALEYTSLNKHPQAEQFYHILTTKKEEAWKIDRDMFEEMKELLIDRLDLNHPIAAPFFGQLNELSRAKKKGFTNFEIIEEVESFVDEETGQARMISHVEKAIERGIFDEPQRKDYGRNLGDYLQAKALWDLAQIQRNKQQQVESDDV